MSKLPDCPICDGDMTLQDELVHPVGMGCHVCFGGRNIEVWRKLASMLRDGRSFQDGRFIDIVERILPDWLDKIYPADIFVGPGSDENSGVRFVVGLRALLKELHDAPEKVKR